MKYSNSIIFTDNWGWTIFGRDKGDIWRKLCTDVCKFIYGDRTLWPLLNFRDAALQRNNRCLLTYFYQRLRRIKALRWEFGPTAPDDIKVNLCEPEVIFFNTYSKSKSFREIPRVAWHGWTFCKKLGKEKI